MRKSIAAFFVGIASFFLPQGGTAGDLQSLPNYPTKPFTLIVPWSVGGGADQLAWAWAKAMEEVTGLPMRVVNHHGNLGMNATPVFMQAPKDGYTLLEEIDIAAANYAAGSTMVNPAEDWEPLCITQITYSQLYIRTEETRFSDWESFLRYSKENPNTLKVSNTGTETSGEGLNIAALEQAFGIDLELVAYDNAAARYASLISGLTDILLEQPGDVLDYLDIGQIQPILTLADHRPTAFSDIPTHRDVGADFEAIPRFRGFFVHPFVEAQRKDFLKQACRQAYERPSFQAHNRKRLVDVERSFLDSAAARKLMADTIAHFQKAFNK